MKIFCCYTKGHEVLFREYFKPSLPRGFELRATLLSIAGAGDFLSTEFLQCIQRKVGLIVTSLRDHPGEIIVWSDIDLIFLQPVVPELERIFEESGKEILFQRESRKTAEVNTGFFVCRCNERTASFFERVGAELRANPGINEQAAVNALLSGGAAVDFGYLPYAYYARTHGWPPSREIAIYHANATAGPGGVGQKIVQFEELRRIREGGTFTLAWSCLQKIPRRLTRMVKERLSFLPR